jgi:uncharacterized protein YceK
MENPMKKNLSSILVILATMALSACNSIPVTQDFEQGFDYSGFKTFAWQSNDDNSWGLPENEIIDRRIRNAITDELVSKQFTQVESDSADFLVRYNVVVEQRVSNRNVSGGISMGRSTLSSSRHRSASIGLSTGSQPRVYERGTMLIDIHDVASNKHVWRGVSAQALPDLSDPQQLTSRINETVEAILKQFPPE